MNDANIQLWVDAILHAKDTIIDLAEEICQNLVFASIVFSLLFIPHCPSELTFVVFYVGGNNELWPFGKGKV